MARCDAPTAFFHAKGLVKIGNKNTRPDWNAIRAEYISGVSYRKLADKYGVSRSCVLRKCKAERWTESRNQAEAKATAKAVQKTAAAAADNAVIAARIKGKALSMIDRLFDEFAEMHATERRETTDGATDIKRLRDLTAAYKDITSDMATGETAGSDLMRDFVSAARRRLGNG